MREILPIFLHMLFVGNFCFVIGRESCPDATERWCEMNPNSSRLKISVGLSQKIACTIPSTPGEYSIVYFVNQFDEDVITKLKLPNVRHAIDRKGNKSTYHLTINWTSDRQAQDKLKVIQCTAGFHDRTHTCRTPIVIIDFLSNDINKQEPTTQLTATDSLTSCSCSPSLCATVNSGVKKAKQRSQLNWANQSFDISQTINCLLLSFSFVMLCNYFIKA